MVLKFVLFATTMTISTNITIFYYYMTPYKSFYMTIIDQYFIQNKLIITNNLINLKKQKKNKKKHTYIRLNLENHESI